MARPCCALPPPPHSGYAYGSLVLAGPRCGPTTGAGFFSATSVLRRAASGSPSSRVVSPLSVADGHPSADPTRQDPTRSDPKDTTMSRPHADFPLGPFTPYDGNPILRLQGTAGSRRAPSTLPLW